MRRRPATHTGRNGSPRTLQPRPLSCPPTQQPRWVVFSAPCLPRPPYACSCSWRLAPPAAAGATPPPRRSLRADDAPAAADGAVVKTLSIEEARPQSDYSDAYECKPEGAVCARKRECCGGAHCLQHTCWADAHRRPPCREGGDRCWDSEDCCSSLVCGVQPGSDGYYDDGHPVSACSSVGQACASPDNCCSPATCPAGTCCLDIGANCTLATADLCCSRTCNGEKCVPPGSCFSGSTLVRVRDNPTPVALRDVKTGQHVQCVAASEDKRTPTQLAWCEVHNWATRKRVAYKELRLSFNRPSGELGHLTLSPDHLVVKLTNPSQHACSTPRCLSAVGSFDMVPGSALQPGDKVAVLTDPTGSSQPGFSAVGITAVEPVEADDMLTPALDRPFIVADGVVASVWNAQPLELAQAPAGPDGINKHVLTHLLMAPAYTQRFEPLGTPGTASKMTEEGGQGAASVRAAIAQRVAAGQAINYQAVQEWWRAAYASRSAEPAATLEDTLALLRSDATWVEQSGGAGSSSPPST